MYKYYFFFSSRRRHTRWTGDWSSDVCSSDLPGTALLLPAGRPAPARPAAPAEGRPAGADVRGARTGPLAVGRAGYLTARRARRVPRGRRQQGGSGQARAPGPADVLRTASADRAHPRHRPGFGRVTDVPARGAAGAGGRPDGPAPRNRPLAPADWVDVPLVRF